MVKIEIIGGAPSPDKTLVKIIKEVSFADKVFMQYMPEYRMTKIKTIKGDKKIISYLTDEVMEDENYELIRRLIEDIMRKMNG